MEHDPMARGDPHDHLPGATRPGEQEPPTRAAQAEVGAPPGTVEEAVRSQLAAMFGGVRGGLEVTVPLAAFALAYVVTEELEPSLIAGGSVALVLLVVRLVQRSTKQFVVNGIVAIGVGAVLASITGQAEDVFLPNIVQRGAFALLLLCSWLVRRPLLGFAVGWALDDTSAMRSDRGVLRVADRLTLIMLAPPAIRTAVELPLYLGGEVGWLGIARLALGWPLSAIAFGLAAMLLARGRTPFAPVA